MRRVFFEAQHSAKENRTLHEICSLLIWSGVEWLTDYWPVATDQTRRSKVRCGVGPKLKYARTTWITLGCVCGSPWIDASRARRWATFCLKKVTISLSLLGLNFAGKHLQWPWQSKRERTTTRGHVIGPWGGGCWVITSKIAQNWY